MKAKLPATTTTATALITSPAIRELIHAIRARGSDRKHAIREDMVVATQHAELAENIAVKLM